MSGGQREAETGTEDDSEGASDINGETARGSDLDDVDTNGSHDLVAKAGETGHDTETTDDKDPEGNLSVSFDGASLVDGDDRGEGTNGIRHIVGTVGEGVHDGGDDLEVAEDALRVGVKVLGVLVDLVDGGLLILQLGMDVLMGEESLGLLLVSLHGLLLLGFSGSVLLVDLDSDLLAFGLRSLGRDLDGLLWGGVNGYFTQLDLDGLGLVLLIQRVLLSLGLDSLLENRNEPELEGEADDDGHTDTNDKDQPDGELIEVQLGTALEEDKEADDEDGEAGNNGVEGEASLEAVRGTEDVLADDIEDQTGHAAGEDGRDQPGGHDLDDLGPVDSSESLCRHGHTDDATDAAVGGGDGETKVGGEDQPDADAEKDAEHAVHEHLGGVGEVVDIGDLLLDGFGDMTAHQESTKKLANTGDDEGVHELEGASSDGGSEGIGDIIGT